jgi:hypothetical protein
VASFYAQLTAVASRLLLDKGQPLTFTREVVTGFDPATGNQTTTTETYTANGAHVDYKLTEYNDTTILRTDSQVILEAAGYVPEVNDEVVIDTINRRVMRVEKIKPALTAVIFKLQVRL